MHACIKSMCNQMWWYTQSQKLRGQRREIMLRQHGKSLSQNRDVVQSIEYLPNLCDALGSILKYFINQHGESRESRSSRPSPTT